MNPANALSQLSPGMAECHARLMAVAKHGTPEAFSATLAGVLQRAELSISNAYDAGAKSIQVEAVAAPAAANEITKAFREYLTVHPSIKFGGHEADTVARELALIVCAVGQAAALTQGAESNMTGGVLDADALSRIETALMMTIEPETAEVAIALLRAQGAAIAAGAVYAELPDDVIDYVKGSYAFLQSTAPDGYAEEVFRLPPSATRNQRSLQDALQSDKRGWHPAAARQDSGDGKRSGPDAGVSASHGQAPAQPAPEGETFRTDAEIVEQTEELARYLLSWGFNHEPADSSTPMRDSTHPFAERSWKAACHIQEMLTMTDVENALAELDAGPTPSPQAAQQAPAGAAEDVDLPDVEDMAHSAVQEALSFGLSHDVIYRWMRAAQDQTVKAMLAAPAAPSTPASGGWIPIEKAPKDGTEFLAVYGRQGNVKQLARWNSLYGHWESKGNWLPGFESNVTAIYLLPASPTIEGESNG